MICNYDDVLFVFYTLHNTLIVNVQYILLHILHIFVFMRQRVDFVKWTTVIAPTTERAVTARVSVPCFFFGSHFLNSIHITPFGTWLRLFFPPSVKNIPRLPRCKIYRLIPDTARRIPIIKMRQIPL